MSVRFLQHPREKLLVSTPSLWLSQNNQPQYLSLKLILDRPKAIIFDLMGTCLDWHHNIYKALNVALFQTTEAQGEPHPTFTETSELALDWRQGFFNEIRARFQAGQPTEDIDDTHRRVLKQLLSTQRWQRFRATTAENIERCVNSWHDQLAWPDAAAALPKLRERFEVVVLANGTTRLQVDITKTSGLDFDMLFSSELLGMTKPDPAIYRKALELLKREPNECVMVAAHAYDLRAAKAVGMRTVYVQRWSEDAYEDMQLVKKENDFFVDAREATSQEGGMLEVYSILTGA